MHAAAAPLAGRHLDQRAQRVLRRPERREALLGPHPRRGPDLQKGPGAAREQGRADRLQQVPGSTNGGAVAALQLLVAIITHGEDTQALGAIKEVLE